MKKVLFIYNLLFCSCIFAVTLLRAKQEIVETPSTLIEAASNGDTDYIQSFLQRICQATPALSSALHEALQAAYFTRNWDAYELIDTKIRELGLF